jgi:hypothetical protein
VRSQQIASGEVVEYGPHNVAVGDWVRGFAIGWYRVAKVNKVTVTIETQQAYGTDRWLTNSQKFHTITGLIRAEDYAKRQAGDGDDGV